MTDLTGVEAWLTLAAGLGLFWGRRPACWWVAAEARWWTSHHRETRAWEAESEPAYRVELAAAAAERAARAGDRAVRSEERATDARALRPVGTPLEALR